MGRAKWAIPHLSSLGDLVSTCSLTGAFKAIDGRVTQLTMLGHAAIHSLSPHPKAGRQGMCPHEIDHIFFGQAKLHFDGLEGRSVLPGHLYDPVLFLLGKCSILCHLVFREVYPVSHKTNGPIVE